ncbi:MAG: type III-B CRISPR module RAMP protein Cmr4 [Thermoflexus sp.]|uniref:type III-B CRISPR module RAMP protein Cmr4 n=1 Tax=Thermoflexus sp. TaxID=1969742 RepID=UPI0025DF695B|nr:type III-B CRISPR module RAMP protein Cmr4 [Thermoflexus sp.]MCS6964100.1 type III-B CRISPR module RAMP protein Cmr4 [Thermoflexus sp.]MDW8186235.1 type III-B CRISPR module RAMP protein Cmr4 [Anaerolineae bacterium]
MFKAASMLFIYVETPLHAGAGRGLGAVDLPIQRERVTGYPIVQASSLKGRLRAEANRRLNADELQAIFGPETRNASDHAGALSVGDARILLFPIRSLAGVFAWTTSRDVLARFRREATAVGISVNWELPPEPQSDTVLVSSDALVAGDQVVLEEFGFQPGRDQQGQIHKIGQWLAQNALPVGPEYDYWRQSLPQKLCVLPESAFRDFVLYATEVQTHIRLNPDTKTVETGALWTTESLPVDTLLYAPLMATQSRLQGVNLSGAQILEKIRNLNLQRIQLGGDETTGQGVVGLRMANGRTGNPPSSRGGGGR